MFLYLQIPKSRRHGETLDLVRSQNKVKILARAFVVVFTGQNGRRR
jgi:hypothetical protein